MARLLVVGCVRGWVSCSQVCFPDLVWLQDPRDARLMQSHLESLRLLSDLVSNLVAAGWQHRQIHLFGFSQGKGPNARRLQCALREERRGEGAVVILC